MLSRINAFLGRLARPSPLSSTRRAVFPPVSRLTFSHAAWAAVHELDLPAGTHILGHELDADIWLPVPGCRLIVTIKKSGMVEAFAADQHDLQKQTRLAGPGRALAFSIADVSVTARPRPNRARSVSRGLIIAGLVSAAVLIPQSREYISPSSAHGLAGSEPLPAAPMLRSDVASQINGRLARIGSGLNAVIEADGFITLAGEAPDTDMKAARELVRSVAMRARPPMALRDAAQTPPAALPAPVPKVSFRAISLRPSPIAFLSDGTTVRVGGVIADWQVTKITAREVQLTRNSTSAAIALP